MTNPPKILAFAGSAREGSCNKKLVKIAAAGAKAAGAEVTYIDLRDFPMPIFDEDLEAKEGLPENAVKIKALMKEHQGFLIACPEYNSSITPLLKNTIDWVSRPDPETSSAIATYFKDKVVAIMSASPGALGGLRGLVHVRAILGNIGVLVLADQKAIPKAFEAFDSEGQLKDPRQQQAIEALGSKVAEVVAKLNQQ